jgi:transglutaminase-like putative cysteine protease
MTGTSETDLVDHRAGPSSVAAAGSDTLDGGADLARIVSCELGFVVVEPGELVLQLAAATSPGRVVSERFEVATDGRLHAPPVELHGPHGARVHLIRSEPGRLIIHYRAELHDAPTGTGTGPDTAGSSQADPEQSMSNRDFARLVYLRPSRYCPSDHLVGFAVAEFGALPTVRGRVEAITEWLRQRIGYVPGSSSVHDSAEDTLLTGVGTCRDFAHLGVALCRAVGIPARFASVYAPGLYPMDFHAVFEALEGGRWCAHDATDLAPRQAMVRIGTGRDAADTAFASVNSGIATLETMEVTATTGGRLPTDDRSQSFELG